MFSFLNMPDIVNGVLLRRGEVLLARRSHHRRTYPNLWSFPGGHVEEGENLDQALCRELQEEIGTMPLDYRRHGRIRDPQLPATVYHLYAVTSWTGEPVIRDGEHSEFRWVTLKAAIVMDGLALEAYRRMLEEMSER